ncbi:sulfite exporter TauE/SafE family protein [uncultured Desulfovibrio sp.]|uniref:sulfite exporter TauE/SafE family protein n=1 Tax=uncultured Desulfovibrio sp. TaxID=167968 RepID=UPI0028048AAB|nr:sulfite exporter TauE/SafE family protein [uncultured Desulfovibrio sp.]
MLVFAYVNLIWFLAGLIVGLTSFGGNLFAMPLLALVMPARDAVVLGCLLFPAMCVTLTVLYRRAILWREVLVLGLSSGLGIPLGIAFLSRASSRTILLVAAFCVFVFLFWQWFATHRKFAARPLHMGWAVPLGIVSGLMSGATGLGGPPLAFYALARQWNKESVLGGLSMAAMCSFVFFFPLQWQAGLYTPELLKTSLWSSAAAILGIFAAMPLLSRINMRLFRALMLGMIALSALLLLVRGLLA